MMNRMIKTKTGLVEGKNLKNRITNLTETRETRCVAFE